MCTTAPQLPPLAFPQGALRAVLPVAVPGVPAAGGGHVRTAAALLHSRRGAGGWAAGHPLHYGNTLEQLRAAVFLRAAQGRGARPWCSTVCTWWLRAAVTLPVVSVHPCMLVPAALWRHARHPQTQPDPQIVFSAFLVSTTLVNTGKRSLDDANLYISTVRQGVRHYAEAGCQGRLPQGSTPARR